MWIETPVFKEDLEEFVNLEYLQWNKLKNKTVLVTGATGLIGSTIVSALAYADKSKGLNINIILLVRNREKAEKIFSNILRESKSISFIIGSVEELPKLEEKLDYIIHGASPTASEYFINKPVETMKTSVLGTINILELAKEKKVEGMVYLSSMEIYGSPKTEEELTEKDVGYINPLMIRNCYPEGKRICEAMCAAYSSEYNVRVMNARLAQTFGPGVDTFDKRVFAEFARCVINMKDIELLTDGSSKRCYLYTMDAVSGILAILLEGTAGNAYNIANPDTYCSIYEMACEVSQKLAKKSISVKILNDIDAQKKYPPAHFLKLNIQAMLQLGWKPTRGLMEMYTRMIAGMQDRI